MIPYYTYPELLTLLKPYSRKALAFDPKLRENALSNPVVAQFIKELASLADKWRAKPICSLPFSYFKLFETTGDRLLFENSEQGYFVHRGRLSAFSLLSYLYGKEEDIAQLEDSIWAICDEYTWSLAAHLQGTGLTTLQNDGYTVDLFASETAQALSEILMLTEDMLSPIVVMRARRLIEERVFQSFLNQTFWWETTRSNWASVCAGSIGIAAMYEIEDDAYLSKILAKVLPIMNYFLESFSQDGACLEGIGYWEYGFSFYVAFADCLYRRTGGGIDLFALPLVEKIALFEQKVYMVGDKTPCFSDGSNHASYNPGMTAILKSHFPQIQFLPQHCIMHAGNDHCYRFSSMLRCLLRTPSELPPFTPETVSQFPYAQWYLASSRNRVAFAAKGGHNNEPHNHNDVGSFHLYKNGETMLDDFGSGEYTKDYFGAGRYTYNACGSQGHICPIIDGQYQKPGREYSARNVTVNESGIKMDIAPAYGLDAVESLVRDIRFDIETGKVTLTDRLTSHNLRTFTERFVTPCKVQIEDGCIHLIGQDNQCTIYYDKTRFTPSVTPADYIGHSGNHCIRFFVDLTTIPCENDIYSFTIE